MNSQQAKLRVLLIDDDEEEYLLVEGMLTDRSYRPSAIDIQTYCVEWVGTYEEALEAFTKGQHDVYLVDYQLGHRNGLELLREVCALDLASPIILMTGHGSYDIDMEAMRVGATDYLSKNELTPSILERTIRYAIERKRTEEEVRLNAARSALLASLSQAFAEAGLEYPEIVKEIGRKISEAFGDPCFVLIKDDGYFSIHHKDPKTSEAARKYIDNLQLYNGLPNHLWGSDPLFLTDISTLLSHFKNLPPARQKVMQDFRSLITVPLFVRGNLIGTLGTLRSSQTSPYKFEDQAFIHSLADRAALAIENARLYANAQLRARELDALHKASVALLATIDLEELLGQILDAAQSAFPAADEGMLYLVVPGTRELKMRAAAGYKDPRIKKVTFPKGTDYPARVLTEKKPMLIHDIAKESVPSQKNPSFRSAIVVPLIHGTSVHGVLSLSSFVPSAFTQHDLHLLESFAATTTAALQNAMLHAEVQKLAITDSLTGYLNRRGFDDLSSRELDRAIRFNRPLSVIMIDIDNFKEINDTYGHAVGDRVLYHLASRLQTSLRDIDVLGRYGGDEFIILLPETDPETASAVAERIRSHFYQPLHLGKPLPPENTLQVSASFGVAGFTNEIKDISELITKADEASYLAKQRGRNRVEVA